MTVACPLPKPTYTVSVRMFVGKLSAGVDRLSVQAQREQIGRVVFGEIRPFLSQVATAALGWDQSRGKTVLTRQNLDNKCSVRR